MYSELSKERIIIQKILKFKIKECVAVFQFNFGKPIFTTKVHGITIA